MNGKRNVWILGMVVLGFLLGFVHQGSAATAEEIDRAVDQALQKLYKTTPAAAELAKQAKGILVFPKIMKVGFVVGGQYGEGALRVGGKTVGYYSTLSGSWGLQVGMQSFGYALFFMTDEALKHLEKSSGWEIGTGPSIVVVDKGAATAVTTTTEQKDIYAFFFDQKGLMGGLGLQGTKISKFEPEK